MLIADRIPLSEVMASLSAVRPVFHSEADFQFAFAQTLAGLAPELKIRLEMRQPGDRREFVDLVCSGARRTLVEFKYATARWAGEQGVDAEWFSLRDHAAMDLVRRNFVFDVSRLERFVENGWGDDGLAILLSNVPGLWNSSGLRVTRDAQYRLHEGAVLTGKLHWGTEAAPAPASDRTLHGRYEARWTDYTDLPGDGGKFRWLAWRVESQAS